MTRVILFDLDGTLMETAPELTDAVNAALARIGQPQVSGEQVRGWIGDGARALMARALAAVGAPEHLAPAAWAAFASHYDAHCGSRSTVHAGVRAMLQRLRAQGWQLALLTNKEGAFAHRLLARHDLAGEFDLIVAGDTLPVKKPDPRVVTHALEALQAEPEDALLVGDAVTDVRTARAAGIAVWLVRHGYPQGELTGDNAPDGFIAHFDQFHPEAAPRVAIA